MHYAGTAHVGFFTDQADIASHQARSAVGCWASRMKGELHPLLKTAFEADLHMDDSVGEGGREGERAY